MFEKGCMGKKFIAILIIAILVAGVGGYLVGQITFIPQTLTKTETFTTTFPSVPKTRTTTLTTTISVKQPTYNPMRRSIETRVDGVIIYYDEELFWSEDYFPEITKNRTEFSSSLVERFEEGLSKHGERGERVIGNKVEFNEVKRSTILNYEVHGAISRSDGSYHATFF